MKLADILNKTYYEMSLNELRLMNDNTLYPDISYNSLLYLNAIFYMENCTASRLAEVLHISKSAVTIKVNELIRQGFVQKIQSAADKRVNHLSLTPEMEEDFCLYDERLRQTVLRVAGRYSNEEKNLFERMLEDIRKEYISVDL